MISIIVSSYKNDLFNNFSKNVNDTIGNIAYEIIQVSNPGLMGICEAYNVGAGKAKYPYLVFAHEDIAFHTTAWGEIIVRLFENDAGLGLLGSAGGRYKSLLPSGWAVNSKHSSKNIIGTHYGESHLSKIKEGESVSLKLENDKVIPKSFLETGLVNEEVLLLDGMFLVTTKAIHKEIYFDENAYKGFHAYDLDYSLQINRHYKLMVSYNILVEHFSSGNFDSNWIKEIKILNNKWRSALPYSLYPISNWEKTQLEFLSFEILLRIHKRNKLSLADAFKPLMQMDYIKKIGPFYWLVLLFKIVFKFIGLFFAQVFSIFLPKKLASS